MEDTEEEYSNKEICLISSDGKRFNLSHDAAKLSEFVCNATYFDNDFDNEIAIQLLKVGSTVLARVVEYLNQYKKHPMEHIITPLHEHTFEGLVKQQWYKDYVIQLDDAELRELKNAANYMGIGPLLDLTSLNETFRLMNKSPEEICNAINTPQLTEQEEMDAMRAFPWVFED